MPIPKNLPTDPFAIPLPDARWTPDPGGLPIDSLLPPLVEKIRRGVHEWRANDYAGASATTITLLRHWFQTSHFDSHGSEFRYYFSQREAIESIIWLYEIKRVDGKGDLLHFDSSGDFIPQDLPEEWRRFVVKMATGSGKTKVISLLIAWSYFHKLYEKDSSLSRNVLLIAPNIIVLDRLDRDFADLRIFYEDPILPNNGVGGKNWRDDFKMRLHRQDEVRAQMPTGNIFLTNIHRVSIHDIVAPSPDDEDAIDYFLGARPSGKTTDSKVDVGEIVREVSELMIINDEAHHIHDEHMAWFKNIQDIHHRMLQKKCALSLQADFTATPKHNNGTIFPHTISDYPLVEAIYQNVVKKPVMPDDESAAKLKERRSDRYAEKFADFINLGVEEWRKADEQLRKVGKKAILFVMTDNTKNCDKVAEYLETAFTDLHGKTLVIHTKENGDFSESQANAKKLQELRRLANEIDHADNNYSAVVSVLVLREGWDVKNVTTIVGLRPYSSASKILPEQTLGRGLRRMLSEAEVEERVSVIGTPAFANFVKEIEKEGVVIERAKMGRHTRAQTPLMIYIDREHKDLDALDIELPILTSPLARDYSRLHELDTATFEFRPVPYRRYDDADKKNREIIFCDVLTGEETHRTMMSGNMVSDYSHVIGYFANEIMAHFCLSGKYYDFIYRHIQVFVRDFLFGEKVHWTDEDTLRNVTGAAATKTLMAAFTRGINRLLMSSAQEIKIRGTLKISAMKTFPEKNQAYVTPKKSAVNCIIGDSDLELRFAEFLDRCPDVSAFIKNYYQVGFKLIYADHAGEPHLYYPDFIVKTADDKIVIVETKGRVDIDDPHKSARLLQWCEDAARLSQKSICCRFVAEKDFYSYYANMPTFADLMEACSEKAPTVP